MTKSYPSQLTPGLFVPQTSVWNDEKDLKSLTKSLYTNLNNITVTLNKKDTGLYLLDEFACGQFYFQKEGISISETYRPREVYRKVINFGALPNTTSKSIAHKLSINHASTTAPDYSFTRIYATASNPRTSFIPIPFSSPTSSNNISIEVDATNVTITTGSDRSAYTTCYAILEYIKY